VLAKIGFYYVWHKGSHVYVRRDHPFAQISVPLHKELDKGTLKEIINQTGLTVDEFIALL